jgi:predicted house-cleaning noncanonical NTP pyrophosphatase (MazG superfamily)
VYALIESNSRITQLQIAKHEKYLGCLEKHEGHLEIDKQASTLRKIRFLVREMRVKKNIPILSDREGYFIMRTSDEALEYIKRIERTAKAQTRAWWETYRSMSKMFNIESEYLEKLADTPTVVESSKAITETLKKSNEILVKAHKRTKKGKNDLPDGFKPNYLF